MLLFSHEAAEGHQQSQWLGEEGHGGSRLGLGKRLRDGLGILDRFGVAREQPRRKRHRDPDSSTPATKLIGGLKQAFLGDGHRSG